MSAWWSSAPPTLAGDTIVHVPDADLVFTGDLLFNEGTPIVWADYDNWIIACDRILELDAAVLVPGHGPVTDASGLRDLRRYLVYVREQARDRFDAGMDEVQAADDIDLSAFSDWGETERIVANVIAAYRAFDPSRPRRTRAELITAMADWHRAAPIMSDLFSLQGKRALVTGGSRGIGLEIARGFVPRASRSRSPHARPTPWPRRPRISGVAVCRQICQRPKAAGLAATIDGPLHILVNNAGATWGAPLEEFPTGLGQGSRHEREGAVSSDSRTASAVARGRDAGRPDEGGEHRKRRRDSRAGDGELLP